MRLAAWGIAAAGLFCVTAIATPAGAAVLGPQPYLCFDNSAIAGCGTADSPFAGGSYSYFHLETFEDGLLNTPGVTASTGFVHFPGIFTDSVDADDGVIDGSGTAGKDWLSTAAAPMVQFSFSAAALGGNLPNHVGIVWTDGASPYTVEFLDSAGVVLGSVVGPTPAQDFTGQTGEDRFFGWTGSVGVGAIRIDSSTQIEADHLQYGFNPTAPVPEPSTWAMLIVGFGGVGYAMRRRPVRRLHAGGGTVTSRWPG